MSRFFIQLLIYLVLFLVLRAVLTRLFSSSRSGKVATRPASSPPPTGELKKDPVCGTYVSASASLSRTVNGETLYFCSPECRDKYLVR